MATKIYDHTGNEIGIVKAYGDKEAAAGGAIWSTSDFTLEYINIIAARINTCTSATLRLHSAGDYPNEPGEIIAYTAINPSGWPNGVYAVRTFNFNQELSANTVYTLSLHTNGSGQFNCVAWARDQYQYYWDSNDGGSNWTRNTVGSLNFDVYGTVTENPPTKATNPTPTNNATEVDFSGFELSWQDGGGADTFNVYIGESGTLTLVSSAQAGITYTTSLSELETIFGVSPINQKIYWRIDSTNDYGTTTGDEWNFDARPAKASVPTPEDSYTDMTLDWLEFSWTGSATTYSTYFGTESGNLSLIVLESSDALIAAAYLISVIGMGSYDTTYYWEVDSVNQFGTTTGDEWSFTTIRLDPPSETSWDSAGGFYYRLLPHGDSPADGGVEDTDYEKLTGYLPNFINTNRRLVAATRNSIYYEDI